MNGLLYTYQNDKKEHRCFMDRGFFGEVIKAGKPLNSFKFLFKIKRKIFFLEKEIQKRILYADNNMDTVHVDNALVIPLKLDNKKILGLLEISNVLNDLSGFDEEYFSIIFTNFLINWLQKYFLMKIYKDELKFYNICKNCIF